MLGQKRGKISYSFIQPHLKPLLSLFSQIWISLILFVALICVSADINLKFYIHNLEQINIDNQVSYDNNVRRIATIKDTMVKLQEDHEIALEIYAINNSLKRSIHNIFDIVPDTITLEYIQIGANSLEIRGKTPSRETFNLLMEAPLRSIFSSVHTSFYQLDGGWLNFSSYSTLNEQDGSYE